MIDDKKRREVAKRFREYDVAGFKESSIVPFLECLGVGYKNWRGILDELADLIDIPTTSIGIDENGHAFCACCGCSYLFLDDDGVRYCSSCGAEVVE